MKRFLALFLLLIILIPTADALNFPRYGSFEDWQSLNDQKNGLMIAKYVDLYEAGNWLPEAINGLHKSGKQVAVYLNVQSILKTAPLFTTAQSDGWLLKDKSGKYISETNFPQNLLVDPANTEYRDFLGRTFNDYQWTGFDYVFADNGFQATLPASWDVSALPINPKTGQLYTESEWRDAWVSLFAYLKQNCPKIKIIANGIFNGYDFYQNKDSIIKFLNETDIVPFSEGVFLNSGTPYSVLDWEMSLNFVTWMDENYLTNSSRKMILYSVANSDSDARFIWGSAALAVSRFEQVYVCANQRMELSQTQSLFKIDLGSPKGDYFRVNNTELYRRIFAHYEITVNPTRSPIKLGNETFPPLDTVIIRRGPIEYYNPTIRIVDAEGNPLSDARVSIDSQNSSSVTIPQITNSSGSITLTHIAPADYGLTVSWKNSLVANTTISIESYGTYTVTVDVYHLKVTILDNLATPVSGAHVIIYKDGLEFDSAITNSSGEVNLTLPKGTYSILTQYDTTYWLHSILARAEKTGVSVSNSSRLTESLTNYPPAIWETVGFKLLVFSIIILIIFIIVVSIWRGHGKY